MRIKPPNVKETWDEMDPWEQLIVMQYCQGRDIEEMDEKISLIPHA